MNNIMNKTYKELSSEFWNDQKFNKMYIDLLAEFIDINEVPSVENVKVLWEAMLSYIDPVPVNESPKLFYNGKGNQLRNAFNDFVNV